MKISYAQNYEDVLIDRLFENKNNGFYIDVGAAHPVKDSVTKYFYEKGWSGVNIEPNRHYCELLKKDRKRDTNLWSALGDSLGEVDYHYIKKDPKISFIGEMQDMQSATYAQQKIETLKVPLNTLSNICQKFAPKEIDFLKIDVEGAEELVLRGMDFLSYRPRLIVVESVTVKGDQTVEKNWVHLLKEAGYESVYFDSINSYFVRNEDSEAKLKYRVPLNASDNFLKYQSIRPKFFLKKLFKNF